MPAQPPAELRPEDTELTSREQEVLHHLLDGQLYKEIAQTMGVSAHTVNFHIQNIYKNSTVARARNWWRGSDRSE